MDTGWRDTFVSQLLIYWNKAGVNHFGTAEVA